MQSRLPLGPGKFHVVVLVSLLKTVLATSAPLDDKIFVYRDLFF